MPTPDQIERLKNPLVNGSALEDAAVVAGIPWPHLSAALDDDPELAAEIDSWISQGRTENLALINRAAIGHPSHVKTTTHTVDREGRPVVRTVEAERLDREWRAAAWLEDRVLPRRRPHRTYNKPSGLTAAVHAIIVASYRINPHIEPAAATARIGYSTLKSWLARGRAYREFLEHGDLADADVATRRLYNAASVLWATDRQKALSALALVEERTRRPEDEPYLDLVLDVEEAVGHLELDLTHSVVEHAKRDGRLALRALQVLYRDRYADRTEVTGPAGAPIEVDVEAKKADALDLLDRVEQARKRADA